MAVLLGVLTPLHAQITTSSLSVQVSDPSGAPVRQAVVEATDASRSFSRSAVTDHTGVCSFVSLPAATYLVSVKAEGFQAQSASIPLAVNTQARFEFSLLLAARRDVLEVSGVPSPLQLHSSGVSMVLDAGRIAGLPLNRRDFLQLALLAPGVAPPVEDSELSSRGAFAMHANGA
ncbi:MAG TPA: hypothetical protein DEH78_02805, partial [Solibacterales bacterium]|nr:hypothetical protein [Bryobacterales bacterium]